MPRHARSISSTWNKPFFANRLFSASSILILSLFPAAQATVQAQQASAAAKVRVKRPPDKMQHIEDLFNALKQNWDSRIITGEMVDEIRKTLDYGADEQIAPLVRRLELLARVGKAYSEDFALWWNIKGRFEVAGPILWDRTLVREAVELSLNEEQDQLAIMRQKLQQAAKSDDPVAKMWYFIANLHRLTLPDPALRGKVEELADAGDIDANYLLGVLELEFTPHNFDNPGQNKSSFYFERAAKAGYLPAMYVLGDKLLNDYSGDEKMKAAGAKWMQQAADQGMQKAIARMADIYASGKGIPYSAKQAEVWRNKLIETDPQGYRNGAVKRAQADLRSLATALESYFVDNNVYPPHTAQAADSINQWLSSQNPQADWNPPSFTRQLEGTTMWTLTTPIAYMTTLPPDPFAVPQGRTYNFWSTKNNWITWSAGPDGKYDLTGREYADYLEQISKPAPTPTPTLAVKPGLTPTPAPISTQTPRPVTAAADRPASPPLSVPADQSSSAPFTTSADRSTSPLFTALTQLSTELPPPAPADEATSPPVISSADRSTSSVISSADHSTSQTATATAAGQNPPRTIAGAASATPQPKPPAINPTPRPAATPKVRATPRPPFSAVVVNQTYDPTNGLASTGDIWRAHQ